MKSIIELVIKDVQTKYEKDIMSIIQQFDVNIDKPRLVKALTNAKEFYEEGYLDGLASVKDFNDIEDVTEEYKNMIELFANDFDLAVKGKIPWGTLSKFTKYIYDDIKLLNKLAWELRIGRCRIVRVKDSE